MKKIVHSSTKYVINGREYNSLEEMPEQDRQFFMDANQNGVPDGIEKIMAETGMPPVQTQKYEVQHKEIVIGGDAAVKLAGRQNLLDASTPPDVSLRHLPERHRNPWVVSVNLKAVLWLLVLAGGVAVLVSLFSGK